MSACLADVRPLQGAQVHHVFLDRRHEPQKSKLQKFKNSHDGYGEYARLVALMYAAAGRTRAPTHPASSLRRRYGQAHSERYTPYPDAAVVRFSAENEELAAASAECGFVGNSVTLRLRNGYSIVLPGCAPRASGWLR